MKKLFAIILCLVMILFCVPFTVFAEDGTDPQITVKKTIDYYQEYDMQTVSFGIYSQNCEKISMFVYHNDILMNSYIINLNEIQIYPLNEKGNYSVYFQGENNGVTIETEKHFFENNNYTQLTVYKNIPINNDMEVVTSPKQANPIKVTAKKSVTAKAKKKTEFKKAVVVKKAKGKVTYKTNNKKVTVKNGTITVAKGLKKGKTYMVKITITAKGNNNFKSKKIVKTIKIKVK